MVTRENRVMLAGIFLGGIAAIVFAVVQPQVPAVLSVFVFLAVFWGVSLVGPHVYLYRQGGGEIPKSARARFLVTLAVAIPLWVGSAMVTDVTVANVGLDVVLGVLCLVVFLVYFVIEARHGYADFAEEAGLR